MKVEIKPSTLKGTLFAPPSKSMAHRLLICAGLAKGRSRISGISDSEDMQATMGVLERLGADCQKSGTEVKILGVDPMLAAPDKILDCRESGSTLRFLIPICLLSTHRITLCGSPRLLERPLTVYEEICRTHGLHWEQKGTTLSLQGPLCGGEFTVAGNISSQFISGLLFALPLCKEDSIIHILPPLESRPYLEMTLAALRHFGISVSWENELTLCIKGGQSYRSGDQSVEGDFSNAAFFDALRFLGHDVSVDNLNFHSLQGDKIYGQYFSEIKKGSPTLSIRQCPDLGPVLMALAAAEKGAILTDTRRLRIKESDRGTAMAEELAKFGVCVTVKENEIVVPSGGLKVPTEVLKGHNDHRIVMSLSILLTKTGGVIEGAEAVKKSLPEFFSLLQSLGCEVTLCETESKT